MKYYSAKTGNITACSHNIDESANIMLSNTTQTQKSIYLDESVYIMTKSRETNLWQNQKVVASGLDESKERPTLGELTEKGHKTYFWDNGNIL